jgi:MoaE-MoaD fusion protein
MSGNSQKFSKLLVMSYPLAMRVRVLFFGVLRDVTGSPEREFEMGDDATVQQVLAMCRDLGGTSIWNSCAVAVNREYATVETRLEDGDEVAVLPPVSGGKDEIPAAAASNQQMIKLVRERIDAERTVSEIKAGADGAVCVFDGIVRDNSRGRRTLHLDYEAYEEMALEQMRGLAAEAVTKFGVRDVAIVHRLGRLMVGETSVLVVVASAHRGAAFDACRWLIDTLKKTVPIWKKEQFVDGATWADGEPFPDSISLSTELPG